MSGAGIMLMSGDGPLGSVCVTDDVSALLEELQFWLGEGPSLDAYHEKRPVLEPDLATPTTPRWLAFTEPAVKAGVRAVFSFPLQVGGRCLGTLNLYCDRSGPLSYERHAASLVMAIVATKMVLVMQADAPPGALADQLEISGDFHDVVHQASGVVAEELGVSIDQGFVRLRAYAFGNERPLAEVVEDVLSRALRFDEPSGEKDPGP